MNLTYHLHSRVKRRWRQCSLHRGIFKILQGKMYSMKCWEPCWKYTHSRYTQVSTTIGYMTLPKSTLLSQNLISLSTTIYATHQESTPPSQNLPLFQSYMRHSQSLPLFPRISQFFNNNRPMRRSQNLPLPPII